MNIFGHQLEGVGLDRELVSGICDWVSEERALISYPVEDQNAKV